MSRYLLAAAFSTLLLCLGCNRDAGDAADGQSQTITIYTSVDRQYAEPILRRFEEETGHRVDVQFDTEARKSAGLAARLEAEREAPRADVFWGNEVFYTARMAEQGLFAPYAPTTAADTPAAFKGEGDLWAGNALRVRVLAVNAQTPQGLQSIFQLTEPAYRNTVVMAQPAFGTTGGHVAALYVALGEERYRDYLQQLAANDMKFVGSNSQTAQLVAEGTKRVGFTDNDDVHAITASQPGADLAMLIPDQEPDGIGTLAIPTTVALVAGRESASPQQQAAARQLVDYLAGPDVEQQLLETGFAAYSVRQGVDSGGIRTMDVSFDAVTRDMPRAIAIAVEVIEGR